MKALVLFLLATAAHAECVVSPPDLSFPAGGGVSTVAIPGCQATAVSFQPWVTVAVVGQTVQVTVQPNPGSQRSTSLQIADRLYLVTQLAAAPTSVPTLSEIALFALMALLAVIAIDSRRRVGL